MILEQLQQEMFVGDPKSFRYGYESKAQDKEPVAQQGSVTKTLESLESVLKNEGSQTAMKLLDKLKRELIASGKLK